MTKLIKIISPIVMIGAIILEIVMVYFRLNDWKIPDFLTIVAIIALVALIIHFGEAIIAAFFAHRKGHNPLKYGIYTFLIGTIGLLELFTKE